MVESYSPTTFATEPGVYTKFIPGQQTPGLPGGVRYPALIGESQSYIERENVPIVKQGAIAFNYNGATCMLTTTEEVYTPADTINVKGIKQDGSNFYMQFVGNNSQEYDLSDIATAALDITEVKVGATVYTNSASPTPVSYNISIRHAGYDHMNLNINANDIVTWTNDDSVPHEIKSDASSTEVFWSNGLILPGATFTHTFANSGVFTYSDPKQPDNAAFKGAIIAAEVATYTYNPTTKTFTFSQRIPVSEHLIRIATHWASDPALYPLPVYIILDGNGNAGPYSISFTNSTINTVLAVELEDISDPLPDLYVTEITRVGLAPGMTDFTSLDYLLDTDNNTIDWGAAVNKTEGYVSSSSTEEFVDKVTVALGTELEVLDETYKIEVETVGAVGVGTYKVIKMSNNIVLASGVVTDPAPQTSIIPGVLITVTDTTGTTVGDTVIVTSNAGTYDEPTAGSTYYVSYKCRKTDFRPKLFFRWADVEREYGKIVREFNADGTVKTLNNLVLAAWLAYTNGANGLWLAQTEFGISGRSSDVDYINALELIKELDVSVVVPLTTASIVINAVLSHVDECSGDRYRKERMGFVSAPPFTTPDDLIGMAQGLANRRMVLVTPTVATLEVLNETGEPVMVTVEGFFLAAAVAGRDASMMLDIAEPITRKPVAGFIRLEDEHSKPEKDRMANYGVLIVQTIGRTMRIRQGITTSTNSWEEREISVTKILDYVAICSRFTCDRYIGTKLLEETPLWVCGTLGSMLKALQHERIIYGFGALNAVIDPNNSTQILASFAVRPTMPCNYIRVEYTIDTRL